jgi:hypothetical protein
MEIVFELVVMDWESIMFLNSELTLVNYGLMVFDSVLSVVELVLMVFLMNLLMDMELLHSVELYSFGFV